MECRRCQELIADFAAGDLVPIQRDLVRQHVASCPDCRQVLAAERRLDALLSQQPLARPPADFTRRVLGRVISPWTVPVPARRPWLEGVLIAGVVLTVLAWVLSRAANFSLPRPLATLWGGLGQLSVESFAAMSGPLGILQQLGQSLVRGWALVWGQAGQAVPAGDWGLGPMVLLLGGATWMLYEYFAGEH
ncbi:MAG: hypothetical protein GKR89_02400 [Candidatus Latescibacteria bacterium]|nr:hypothetical protein [Candidatus Latescibacterota bacterium]